MSLLCRIWNFKQNGSALEILFNFKKFLRTIIKNLKWDDDTFDTDAIRNQWKLFDWQYLIS
jgi:hypothetical protein